jgi:hypothetical protein
MIKDFMDGNKAILTTFRGTDTSYQFPYVEDNGSVFIWGNYTVTCEGRLSSAIEKSDFAFPVSQVLSEYGYHIMINFPSTIVTNNIRENKIYWRVLAKDNTTLLTKVIRYGELWLKEM